MDSPFGMHVVHMPGEVELEGGGHDGVGRVLLDRGAEAAEEAVKRGGPVFRTEDGVHLVNALPP